MSLSRRSLLKHGLTAGAILGLQLPTGITQKIKPSINVYKSPT